MIYGVENKSRAQLPDEASVELIKPFKNLIKIIIERLDEEGHGNSSLRRKIKLEHEENGGAEIYEITDVKLQDSSQESSGLLIRGMTLDCQGRITNLLSTQIPRSPLTVTQASLFGHRGKRPEDVDVFAEKIKSARKARGSLNSF